MNKINRFKSMKKSNLPISNANAEHKVACGLHCIKIDNISVKIGNNSILNDVNLHIHCGKLTTIIGRNGAGKSTLMKAILGEIPHDGTISFRDISNNEFVNLRVGYVPQHLNIAKNTPTSVYDLFASFISNTPVFLYKNKKTYQHVKEQLAVFEADDLIDKAVCDLSGGELQRVLLSIAISPIPNLLLLDEPISGIDHNGMELFYKNIEKLKENYDLAIIMISHDFEFVKKYSDNVVLLDKTIIKEGTPDEVLCSSEFITAFGVLNSLEK